MSATSMTMVTGALVNPAKDLLARAIPGMSETDRMAVSTIPTVHRFVSRDSALVSEGDKVVKLRMLCSGWAVQSVGLSEDRRQIIGFVLPGDLVSLHGDRCDASICDIITLTTCEVAEFDLVTFLEIARMRRSVGEGLRRYMEWSTCILSDHVLRLGRMTAYERVCHFLLEMHDRQVPLGQAEGSVEFPITQTTVADALGLSVVHVNRQVMQLRREGLVSLDRRSFTIHDVERMKAVCGYKSRGYCAERA